MIKVSLLMLLCLVSAANAIAQGLPCDATSLRDIATELRGMHAEAQQQGTRDQVMQVLLFELQSQQAVVEKSIQRADEARSRVLDLQEGERHVAADLARSEEVLRTVGDQSEKARLATDLERQKAELASLKVTEQERLTAQQQADVQSQRAQSAYGAIQAELEKFVKTLEQPQKQTISK